MRRGSIAQRCCLTFGCGWDGCGKNRCPARIFINVEGREPLGTVPAAQYEAFRDELAEALRSIPAPDGSDVGTRVFKPQEVYQEVRNIPPDLMVYFGDLSWRSVGSFGHGGVYTFENDTGPDDANHAENGLFILADPRVRGGGRRVSARRLMDIAPTILEAFGLPIPPDMQGSVIGQQRKRRGPIGLAFAVAAGVDLLPIGFCPDGLF